MLGAGRHIRWGRHFTLGAQRQFGRDYALSLDGVYNKGRRSIVGVEVDVTDAVVHPVIDGE